MITTKVDRAARLAARQRLLEALREMKVAHDLWKAAERKLERISKHDPLRVA